MINLRDIESGTNREDAMTRSVPRLIEFLEFVILAEPFRRIVHQLCEQARHKVLGTSVEKFAGEHPMEQLLHGIWLADVDPKKGMIKLKEATKTVPDTIFLRVTMASHLLTRVYWNHWKKDDRLALLDVAADSLKAVNMSLNKAELKRMIERNGRPPVER